MFRKERSSARFGAVDYPVRTGYRDGAVEALSAALAGHPTREGAGFRVQTKVVLKDGQPKPTVLPKCTTSLRRHRSR